VAVVLGSWARGGLPVASEAGVLGSQPVTSRAVSSMSASIRSLVRTLMVQHCVMRQRVDRGDTYKGCELQVIDTELVPNAFEIVPEEAEIFFTEGFQLFELSGSIDRATRCSPPEAYVVDRIFAAHLRGEAHPYASANLSEMPTLEDLSSDLRRSDQEYIDYVSTVNRNQLAEPIDFTFTDGAPGRMSREEMLMHVVTHGTGHRGQVSAVMLLNSVAPAKDGFATYLHEAQASTRRRALA
jgi:uncharacterized damage-inducible protein DinB